MSILSYITKKYDIPEKYKQMSTEELEKGLER